MSVDRLRYPLTRTRRWGFSGLVAASTGAGVWMMAGTVSAQGLTALEVLILLLFTPTFAWIVIPFWTAVFGFLLRMARVDPVTLDRHGIAESADPPTTSVTAVVVPVYNETPEAVAARVGALLRSLAGTGYAQRFHVHLLSDTSDDDIARREEREWVRLQAEHPEVPVFYRRRASNAGRKAGNVGEFCRRCSEDYDFMVVLDADSLMTGPTLVRLAGVMEANPDLGLLQTVPLPVMQRTLFGRLIQFAGSLYGPVLAAGQAFWQADAGNYWGHNAIIRLRPFLEHCELPVLPGRAPLGGEILSHDFVEAALLRRAGWKVVMAPELGGSWEECPGNVLDYAARDRRWAQGSLQHLRLLGIPGLHPISRLHFMLGAMGYLASLLWLLILLAGTAYVLAPSLHGPTAAVRLRGPPVEVSLLAVTAVILFLPKLLGVLDGLFRARTGFGGTVKLTVSALVEGVFSVLLAPVMMLYHARFVLAVYFGRAVGWETGHRDGGRLSWSASWRAGGLATVVGLLWGGTTLAVSPLFFAWMSPIFTGLLLSVPLLRWTSSPELGRRAVRAGLLTVPSEAMAPGEVRQVRRALQRLREGGFRGDVPRPPLRWPGDPRRENGVLLSPRDDGSMHSLFAGSTMYNAERGLFDLRQGRALLVTEARGAGHEDRQPVDRVLASVEGLTSDQLDRLRSMGSGAPSLVLTHHRIAAMGLQPARTNGSGGHAFALPLDADVGLHRVVELSCGAAPVPGTEDLVIRSATSAEASGLGLVRLGRLLPAVVSLPVEEPYPEPLRAALDRGALLRVDAEEARAFSDSAGAEVVPISEAPVPLAEAADSRFILFREGHGLQEHVAILVGSEGSWPDPVPVRLHSACLTGDLFGSLRCDCGEQLRGSMALFSDSGGGVLLYLAQEGRGIGLRNKFRAYTLQ
ncbi:MAG: glucans biosynthesis glucosyltransferase MdoH, partial [Longimicrobiales bacterium]|nr:glucans biosynthesis glucosyltransferase MdoH [Longimicrobiales bacterium]